MARERRGASRPEGPFRTSPLGPLPATWSVMTLGELTVGEGRYGSPASALEYDAGLPRYVRISDIATDGSLRRDSRASIDESDASPYRLRPGDLLFARSGATCGKTYLYDPVDGECAYAGYLIRFTLDRKRCEPAFVAAFTRTSFYRNWLRRTRRQAAQPNINAAEFAALPVPLPPRGEQRRIARILATQDRVVRAGQRVADKLAVIRVALLHELFRRGVDHSHGGVRAGQPYPTRATALGPLPRHFDVARLGDLLLPAGPDDPPSMRSGPFGSDLRKGELSEDGVPLIGIDNVGVDRFIARYRRFVPWRKADELARFRVRPGDVLVTVMGTVGRACTVPGDVGVALSSKHVWTLTLDTARYLPELVSLQLNHAGWVAEQLRRDEQGGTMAGLRSDALRRLLLPVPPIAEQHRMRDALLAMHRRELAERADLAKRRRMTRVVIDDLMSGRVRVPRRGE